jgi:hypothetical protein
LFNQVTTQKPLDVGKSISIIDRIREAFNYEENFSEGYDAGAGLKQKQADDLATLQARIESNPDLLTTQKSAHVYKQFGTGGFDLTVATGACAMYCKAKLEIVLGSQLHNTQAIFLQRLDHVLPVIEQKFQRNGFAGVVGF